MSQYIPHSMEERERHDIDMPSRFTSDILFKANKNKTATFALLHEGESYLKSNAMNRNREFHYTMKFAFEHQKLNATKIEKSISRATRACASKKKLYPQASSMQLSFPHIAQLGVRKLSVPLCAIEFLFRLFCSTNESRAKCQRARKMPCGKTIIDSTKH
jgi:hypothetical protein